MPILHLKITQQNQVINLPTDINAQMLTLRKACITTESVNTSRACAGGIAIRFPWLSGTETTSNVLSNHIIIPFDEKNTELYAEIRFDMDLQAEHIDRSFRATIDNFEGKPIQFHNQTSGEVATKREQIDLFCEYKTTHKFF
jgi:phosphohistidine swiveling domain-containing protein